MTERVVVITGGSRGLGAGIVQSYLDSGDLVATCARTPTEQTEKWAADPDAGSRFLFTPADLSSSTDAKAFVDAVIERWGRIDVLVNDVDTVVDLNLKGTIYMSRLVSRRMLARGSGYIVNVSSIVGRSGYRGLAVYSATKAALDGFTRALARELGSRGIVVNGIAPGYLRTEMSHGLDEAQLGQIVRRTPAGRLGEPADIARAIQFLTDPANTYLTGQILVVDGGLTS